MPDIKDNLVWVRPKFPLSYAKIARELERPNAEKKTSINKWWLWLLFPRIMTIPGNAFRPVGRSLIRLNLRNNRMTNIVDPEAFGGLKALEELNLSRNKMSSFPKQLFANLKSLQVIFIESSSLYVDVNFCRYYLQDYLVFSKFYAQVSLFFKMLFIQHNKIIRIFLLPF